MPVRKFRDVSEMEENTWREPGTPELFRAIRELWEFSDRILRPRFPPGVYKHRTLEEAEDQRQRWEEANFKAHRDRLERDRKS
ncbi:MAG: hypothetical protein KDD47_13095 [Acidobacteria bacterium]|nr:hypothetical protein [Acidobacteriota bacterium]